MNQTEEARLDAIERSLARERRELAEMRRRIRELEARYGLRRGPQAEQQGITERVNFRHAP